MAAGQISIQSILFCLCTKVELPLPFMFGLFSYMESEQYEEAVRDYELLCRKDRSSRGNPLWKLASKVVQAVSMYNIICVISHDEHSS